MTRMLSLILIAICFLGPRAAIAQQADAAPRKLVIGTRHVPPFAMKQGDGSWVGISIELWREVAAENHWDYELRETELPALLEAVEQGELDAAVAAITVTHEREEVLDFSHPFYSSGLGIAVRKAYRHNWLTALWHLLSWELLALFALLTAMTVFFGLVIWLVERRRKRIRSGKNPIRHHGAGFLAYAILDTIVDGYYPVVESIGDYLESLEDKVVADPSPRLLQKLNRMKNQLVNLRRVIWPQREAIHRFVHDDSQFFDDDLRVYLRDTYDHCVQTSEVIEMYREMVTGLINTYLSSIANRTNDVMKVLTIMASIFIPLTFMAGVYGMNFEQMPELKLKWSYPLLWLVMLSTAAGMVIYFRRLGWIGGSSANDENEDKD